MTLKHKELIISPDNPFENCKLGRAKYANVLNSIIDGHPQGFVLSINNRWGTGKTTFIKMWEQDLRNQSLQTIYFNAWENDFEDNPLIALMGELKVITQDTAKDLFKKVLKNAAPLSKNIVPLVAAAIADRYINIKLLNEAIVGASEGISDIFENEVKDYVNKKDSVKEFRQSLSEFIHKTNNGKPLIFFIDELDRCRPNYAVSILEQIKHFFSVSNIVFVLSIDKVQLGNAIRGVYGSEYIDTDDYLRRFIDIEYSIPEPEKGVYYNYLYDYFEFDDFFASEHRKNNRELGSDKNDFLKISEMLFDNTTISLRQQEKIFAHARLALRSFKALEYVVPTIFLLLTYIKLTNINLYIQIRNKSLSINDLQEKFKEIVGAKVLAESARSLIWAEAHLILFYNNYLYGSHDRSHIYNSIGAEKVLLIKSIINPSKNNDLLEIFEAIDRTRNIGHLSIIHLMNKIDLTTNIQL